jgi:ribosome-associated translation inhibitor RaiA
VQISVEITWDGMKRSEAVEAVILTHSRKLIELSDRIHGCRVVAGPLSKHHQHGNAYRVRIELSLAGGNRVVASNHSHEDVYVAVRDAFQAARRQLTDHLRLEGHSHRSGPDSMTIVSDD